MWVWAWVRCGHGFVSHRWHGVKGGAGVGPGDMVGIGMGVVGVGGVDIGDI